LASVNSALNRSRVRTGRRSLVGWLWRGPDPDDQPARTVEPAWGGGVSIAAGPFPQAARRTRRAVLTATDSPWFLPWVGSGSLGPGVGDLVAPVVVPRDGDRSGLNRSIPSALMGCHRPVCSVSQRRTSFHFRRCRVRVLEEDSIDAERINFASKVAIDGFPDTSDKLAQLRIVVIRDQRARRPSLRPAGHESEVTHGLVPRNGKVRKPGGHVPGRRGRSDQWASTKDFSEARSFATASASRSNSSSVISERCRRVKITSHPSPSLMTRSGL
jgi:hypothetical protein